ncbi:MAG: hypothetical protein COA58_12920 [Bacteroidetes bacterium]|nr:MAG: hypothetical protein COA58_12920 [Bacteroidota bacterium]
MHENCKLLISFTYVHEAHVVKGYLESKGINVLMADELTIQQYNFYSNAIGGVKLLVHTSEYDESIDLLKKGGYLASENNNLMRRVEQVPLEKDQTSKQCPFCSSINIRKGKKWSISTSVLYFLVGVILPFGKKTFVCFDCEHEWKFNKSH